MFADCLATAPAAQTEAVSPFASMSEPERACPNVFRTVPRDDVERVLASMRISNAHLPATPTTPRGTTPRSIDLKDWQYPQRTYQQIYDTRLQCMSLMLSPRFPDLYNKGDVIACESGDTLKGIMTLALAADPDLVLIGAIVTHPGFARTGTAMVKEAIRYAREHGRSGKLGLGPLCEDAAKAFEAMGFKGGTNAQFPLLMVLDPADDPRWQ
jgi:GNAT superfamily N-acetyltransferase